MREPALSYGTVPNDDKVDATNSAGASRGSTGSKLLRRRAGLRIKRDHLLEASVSIKLFVSQPVLAREKNVDGACLRFLVTDETKYELEGSKSEGRRRELRKSVSGTA